MNSTIKPNISNIIYIHVLAIIIAIMLIFLVIVLTKIEMFDIKKKNHDFPGQRQEFRQHNCDTELIYSMTDDQCNSICREPGVFVTRNGTCVNIQNFNQTAIENECNPKNGVLAYLLGDPEFGTTKLLCLSIDPGVQPDNIKLINTLCMNGDLEINYIESFPNLKHCTCADDEILATILDTSTIRTRGVCIKKQSQPIYELNRLIYSDI
ncbi:PIF-3 [Mauternbach virus]|uniref:PIF-3 n=1 Tax=Mauternbach virus TaxID=2486603 RepID=A0A3G3E664_9VIRU|nr:PIF-3 [Mauternbach virus]AYP97962.1 PIF-3 [Mauternbach virus]